MLNYEDIDIVCYEAYKETNKDTYTVIKKIFWNQIPDDRQEIEI